MEIELDWESVSPNVYGYQVEGTPKVFVGGELLRIAPLYGPAMAVALGFGVMAATSDKENPGRALFDGVTQALFTVLGPYWGETVRDGQMQFQTVFDALAVKEREHRAEEGLTARCLGEVIDAAVSGYDMPRCAGSPTLAITGAHYHQGFVVAEFNTELEPTSAADPAHYAISPDGAVSQVSLESDLTRVRITMDLSPDGNHELTVRDLLGADGSTLNPQASSAPIENL